MVVVELQSISDDLRALEKNIEELRTQLKTETNPEELPKLETLLNSQEKEYAKRIEDFKQTLKNYTT
jgi:hypothetical protein